MADERPVCCLRCRKPITGAHYQQWRPAPEFRQGGYVPLHDGMVIGSMVYYHAKCLPPNIFHKLAGSHPAAPTSPDASLSHDSTGQVESASDWHKPLP